MKDIIMFPGHVAGPFFENEIGYVKAHFNIAAILAYGDTKKDAEDVLARHGIPAEKLYIIPHVSSSLTNGKLNPFRLFLWLFRKEARAEIKGNCFKGRKKIKRFLSAARCGGYALLSEDIIQGLDIGHADMCLYSFWMDEAAYACAYLKSRGYFPEVRLVCRAHRGDLYEEKNDMGYLPFRPYINEAFDRISFISRQGLGYFTAKYPKPDNKTLSYLGVAGGAGAPKQIYDKDEICIASCSYVKPEKRLDLIISAMARLDGLKARWIHLGGGPLFGQMKALAKKELSGTSVEWEFSGPVPNAEIPGIYKKNDVDFFINLSDSEGLPVSLMEAFSAGIPAVARSVGGTAEIVGKDSGLLLDEKWDDGNFEKIKEFIKSRTDRKDEYIKLSRNCYEVWERFFDADKNYDGFFQTL